MPAPPSYLSRRQSGDDRYYGYRYRDRDPNSNWNVWGRYVAAVAVIFLFFVLLVLFTIRRRQRRGYAPYNGTAWIARKFSNNGRLRGGGFSQPQPYTQRPNSSPPLPSNGPPTNGESDAFYDTPAPPYTPNPEFQSHIRATSQAPSNSGFEPPPGPPPMTVYDQQAYEMASQPINQQYTGTTIQSNNPYFQPPSSPPPAHLSGGGTKR